jgi:hypothetical protein
MRTQTRSTAILLALLMLAMPVVHATPPSSGESATISEATTWTEDATMDGDLTVAAGASLTINANITMQQGSSITVEEGAQLVLTNGALISNDLNAGLRVDVNPFAPSVLTLNFGDLADDGVLQLKFDHIISDGGTVDVTYGNTTINASGSEIVQFNVPLNGTDLEVSIATSYLTPTYVMWAKAIHSGGDTATLMAQDISASEAPLYWFQSGFEIHAHGEFTVNSSSIMGASISCDSLCSFDNAALSGSAPINAASTANMVVLNSIISGSRTDEDIILHDQATITYTNSQGTGGTTDAWIRLLSQRSLSTNIPNGSLDITGLGWGSSNWNDLTDANGDILLVDGGETNEHKRIVEWMDGYGVVQQEEATITLSITSNWGTFSKTITAPKTANSTLNLDLPYVHVTALEPEDTKAISNRSIGMMMTVENTGSEDVVANIWCYVGDEPASTAPSTITVSMAAGESKQVPITWYVYEAGDAELTCRPLLPTALDGIADLVAEANGTTSTAVTWENAVEAEEAPLVIYAAVVIGFALLALFAATQMRASGTSELEELPVSAPEEEEEKDYEKSSIYDLSTSDSDDTEEGASEE